MEIASFLLDRLLRHVLPVLDVELTNTIIIDSPKKMIN